jgi:hypothetical protein
LFFIFDHPTNNPSPGMPTEKSTCEAGRRIGSRQWKPTCGGNPDIPGFEEIERMEKRITGESAE